MVSNNGLGAFVWADTHGAGRNRYLVFRLRFALLSDDLVEAEFRVFVDSRYRLIVNGTTLGHGPARFFVSGPEYDSYNLKPHLVVGTNEIVMVANSFACLTFQTDLSTGGFAAGGVVADRSGGQIELGTPGNWEVVESPGHIAETHYLSFAIGPAECLDLRHQPTDWNGSRADQLAWKPVVERHNCAWGELKPRSIPMLDESFVAPERLRGAWIAHAPSGERMHSLFVVASGRKGLDTRARVAVLTHLHSSVDQVVTLGTWWGAHFLNGAAVKADNVPELGMRQNLLVRLNKGWNRLVVFERLGFDFFDFSLGVPESSGVSLSASGNADSNDAFFIGGPWEGESADLADSVAWADVETDSLPEKLGPWRPWPRDHSSPFPMKQRGWRKFEPLDTDVHRPAPNATTPGAAVALLFEFLGESLGRPKIEFIAAAGTKLDLFYGERLKPDGTLDAHRDPWGIHTAERYVTTNGRQEIHTFHPRGLKYLELLIAGDLDQFELHAIGFTRANYPVEFLGEFECSDPDLIRLWKIGRDTQHACMEDAYLDCPWRERGLYAGDMLVQFAVNRACFGDTKLLRRCLELFFRSQDGASNGLIAGGAFGLPAGRHPDYSAITLIALYEYWAATGDGASVAALFPRASRVARGLAGLHSHHAILLDGSDIEPYIDNCHMDKKGLNCALNCFYQRAFWCFSELCRITGDVALESEFSVLATNLAEAIRASFWDARAGAFMDRLISEEPETTPSVPANALPLLWKIAAPSQVSSATDWLVDALENNCRVPEPKSDNDLNVNAYFAYYALEALYARGHSEAAERFIRKQWQPMLDANAWTCWEYFLDSNSRCHAWSASPTHFLSSRVLGVSFPYPGEPNKICIQPHPGSLTWAKGIYPHPLGPIKVDWKSHNGSLHLHHEAPPGVMVEAAAD